MDNLIGERLRRAREKTGLTQQQLAEKADKTPATVNRYEKGHRVPDAEYLDRLVRLSACDGTWLLTGEGEMHKGGAGQASQAVSYVNADHGREVLSLVVLCVEEHLQSNKLNLPPAKKAELIVTLYEMFTEEEKQVDRKTIAKLIQLAI